MMPELIPWQYHILMILTILIMCGLFCFILIYRKKHNRSKFVIYCDDDQQAWRMMNVKKYHSIVSHIREDLDKWREDPNWTISVLLDHLDFITEDLEDIPDFSDYPEEI